MPSCTSFLFLSSPFKASNPDIPSIGTPKVSIIANFSDSSGVNFTLYFCPINSRVLFLISLPITLKKTLSFPPIVIVAKSVSGNLVWFVDAGMSTGSASCCFAVAVRIKNVSKRKATSHIAVISIDVAFLDIFTLLIFFYL